MPTTPEMNKAIIRQFFAEVINQGNLARADELFAPTTSSMSRAAPHRYMVPRASSAS